MRISKTFRSFSFSTSNRRLFKKYKNKNISFFSVSTTSTVVSVSSKLSSLKAQIDEEDVKSIFVGATKYEILNYLEDAKERGMDNLSTDLGTGMIYRNDIFLKIYSN